MDYIYGTRENGALFHLAMLALKHFEYEVIHGGNTAYKVLDIESNFNVQLYKKNAAGGFDEFGEPHGRRMDIVLAGEAGNETLNEKVRWVEVKSYKRPPNSKYFQPWKLSSEKSYPNHRQFFLDRVALVAHGEANTELASDFEWWFHGFKRQTIEGYRDDATAKDLDKVSDYFIKLPSNREVGRASLGLAAGEKFNSAAHKTDVRNRLKIQNVKTWITVTAKDHLLDNIPQELIDELITNAINDSVL